VDGARYEILIRGPVSRRLSVWFEDMDFRPSGSDETQLIGHFEDQAALQGFLAEINDLGLELAGVRRLETDELQSGDSLNGETS